MEELLKTRQLLIQTKLLKQKNYDYFDKLIEEQVEDLLSVAKISQVLYHFQLDWQTNNKYFEIVKNEYDTFILDKYNIDIESLPTNLYQNQSNLGKDAMMEITYYTYLNKCYSLELKEKIK
jgi:hypothetical protein